MIPDHISDKAVSELHSPWVGWRRWWSGEPGRLHADPGTWAWGCRPPWAQTSQRASRSHSGAVRIAVDDNDDEIIIIIIIVWQCKGFLWLWEGHCVTEWRVIVTVRWLWCDRLRTDLLRAQSVCRHNLCSQSSRFHKAHGVQRDLAYQPVVWHHHGDCPEQDLQSANV